MSSTPSTNRSQYLAAKKRGSQFFKKGGCVSDFVSSGIRVDPTGGFFDHVPGDRDEYVAPTREESRMTDMFLERATKDMLENRRLAEQGKQPSVGKQKGFWRYRRRDCDTQRVLTEKTSDLHRFNNFLGKNSDVNVVSNVNQVALFCASNGAPHLFSEIEPSSLYSDREEAITGSGFYKDFESELKGSLLLAEKGKILAEECEKMATDTGGQPIEGEYKVHGRKGGYAADMVAYSSPCGNYCLCLVKGKTFYKTHFYVRQSFPE